VKWLEARVVTAVKNYVFINKNVVTFVVPHGWQKRIFWCREFTRQLGLPLNSDLFMHAGNFAECDIGGENQGW
jgi:hypothetical protein